MVAPWRLGGGRVGLVGLSRIFGASEWGVFFGSRGFVGEAQSSAMEASDPERAVMNAGPAADRAGGGNAPNTCMTRTRRALLQKSFGFGVSPSGRRVKRERSAARLGQICGCPRNCKRRATPDMPLCCQLAGWEGPAVAVTRKPGDLPRRSRCPGAGRAMGNGQSVAVTCIIVCGGVRSSKGIFYSRHIRRILGIGYDPKTICGFGRHHHAHRRPGCSTGIV